MKSLSQRTNRGESVILGYVLLVVLAIGMAGAVYAYLRFYLPKDHTECPQGVSLIIASTSCSSGNLTLTLVNKGLFSVNGSYIKVGEAGRTYKTLVNCPGPGPFPPECRLYFTNPGDDYVPRALAPGEHWTGSFSYTGVGQQEIEVEPFIATPGRALNASFTLCSESVVTQTVQCT